ncbi:hypothetical protein [Singulisphaera acidiphila]|uniref:Carboxypeptidase regulatory-like domain-containing protein n=1 Tax=Singulisphaera acidiphila (strain ATCC BAA-1392 / DSM 18658 / VKM B-2454 / MOB10) TaxID=886293 RepID=L0DCQ5_SINAD|nr:hypothetical protein [Singulisphaera acidiphila]AGA27022.1 hypothetical protein Sinac_2726 [Singulisphaera acidiphila DSM 18658]
MSLFDTFPALQQSILAGLPLVVVLGLSGCGGGTSAIEPETLYVTKGKVELADGTPLSSGKIEFLPLKARVAETIGEIAPDGSYAIKTNDVDQAEGASPGEYKIRILPGNKNQVRRGVTRVVNRSRLPYNAKYLNEETSQLTATIKAETNELPPFRLTK